MNYKEALNLLNQVLEAQNTIKNEIYNKLKETPDIDGITRVNDFIIIVPYSKLNSLDWSPKHYNTKIQIECIWNFLKKSDNLQILKANIERLIKEQKIKISQNEIVRLNYQVLNTLQTILKEMQSDEKD